MTNLYGRAPSDTFQGLLTLDNNGLGLLPGVAGLRSVQDGNGISSPLQLSTTDVNINASATFNSTGAITLPSGTTAQRPVPPVNGMIRYNTTSNLLEAYINGAWQNINAGGNADFLLININQPGHPFTVVGQVAMYNLAGYQLAQADNANDANVVGIVSFITDAANFTLQMGGHVTNLAGLANGTVYFLSPTVAGAMTAVAPVTVGQIRKPLLMADSATSGYWLNYQGQQL